MAGIQFAGGKLHTAAEAKAILRHITREEKHHTNTDINESLTPNNTDLHGTSYADMCDFYDDQIAIYKSRLSHAMRKDAVTLYDAVITIPAAMANAPAEKQDSWYRDVESVINKHYGRQVVMDIKIHRDEIHNYVDPTTGKTVTSRTHGHCVMFPEIDGKLNAKAFSSRTNIRSLNREIDAMTKQKYHCPFLTGELTKDRGFQSVEQLKVASDIAAKERERHDLILDIDNLAGVLADLQQQQLAAIKPETGVGRIMHPESEYHMSRDAYNALQDAERIPRDLGTRVAALERREAAVKQCEQRLHDSQRQADQVLGLLKQTLEDLNYEIRDAAKDFESDDSRRMEEFMALIQFDDGSTALDYWRKLEDQRLAKCREEFLQRETDGKWQPSGKVSDSGSRKGWNPKATHPSGNDDPDDDPDFNGR